MIGHSQEEKSAFREGLRFVLQKMKSEKIDDFETVTMRMVEYRRSRQESAYQSVSSVF